MKTGILGWLLLWSMLQPGPVFSVEAPELPTGSRLEEVLEAGAQHTYRIEHLGGSGTLLEVEQNGIDVVLTIYRENGEVLVAVDSPQDRQGTEQLLLGKGVPGNYLLEVRSRETTGAPGQYVIHRTALRDPQQLAAASATSEGGRLYLEGSPEAWRQALEVNARAAQIWREAGQEKAEARARYANTVLHRLLQENRTALELGREVLPLWRSLGDRLFEANTLNELGLNQWHLSGPAEARLFFAEALELQRTMDHRWGEAVATLNLCLMDLVAGELRAGAECHERTVPLLDEVRALDLASTAATNAGRAYNILGEPERALASYQRALELARPLEDAVREARTLNNLGVLQRELGNYPEALAHFHQALKSFQAADNRRWQVHVLNNLGVAYQAQGLPERALTYFRQALPQAREIEHARGESIALTHLGRVHHVLGQFDAADGFFQQALAAWQAVGDPREEAIVRVRRGTLALDRKKFTEAAELLNLGASALEELGDPLYEAEARREQALAQSALGQLQEARELAERALHLAQGLGYPASEAQALGTLARIEERAGKEALARKHVQRAIELIEGPRAAIRSPMLRASYAGTFHELYEFAIDLQIQSGDPRGALETSERGRARTLLELLLESGVASSTLGTAEEHAERRSLVRRLNAKAERAVRLAPDAPRKVLLEQEIEALLLQLDTLATHRQENRPQSTAPLTTAQIQALADDDTTLLVFHLGESRSFLWQITPSTLALHELPPRKAIETLAQRFHKGLQSFDPNLRPQETKTASELANALFDGVTFPAPTRRLAIVPDGALFLVPFEALPLPKAGGPLLERFEVTYLPSASVLAKQRSRANKEPSPSQRLALFADPVFTGDDPRLGGSTEGAALRSELSSHFGRLPATRREAEAIANLAPAEVLTAFGFDARRDRLLGRSLAPYGYIHLATHGIADTRSPALSGMVLSHLDAKGQPVEGFLGLQDIYGLDLQAQLVVLSGCRTALGRQLRGEGVWGLRRAFLAAGAQRVLASLWPVEDRATATLMQHFYRGLWQEGLPPAAALRDAKLALAKERRWRSPHFWAAFVLEGDWVR